MVEQMIADSHNTFSLRPNHLGDYYICNLAGQDGYGTDRKYTDYDALLTALAELHDASISLNLPVYIPYRMGCGLGGGDWEIVSRLIDECCPNAFVVKP
jgi:hypothetical protein